MPTFGARSKACLEQAHPQLVEIAYKIIPFYDFAVLESHRTRKQHEAFLKKKLSKVPYEQSKHSTLPSKAVHFVPWPIPGGDTWGKEWKDRVKFYELAALVRYEAKRAGYNVRWGGDWDGDYDYKDQTFDDLAHFELI